MEETWVAALQVRGAAWGLVCVCVNTQGTKTSTARRHGGDRLKVNVMDCLCFVGGGGRGGEPALTAGRGGVKLGVLPVMRLPCL